MIHTMISFNLYKVELWVYVKFRISFFVSHFNWFSADADKELGQTMSMSTTDLNMKTFSKTVY